jgi:hypothetical protein
LSQSARRRAFSPLVLSSAAAVVALCAPRAQANEVVFMKSGSKLEVSRTYESGASLFCVLEADGGTVSVPMTSVKRVSSSSDDMPGTQRTLVAESSSAGPAFGSSGTGFDSRTSKAASRAGKDPVLGAALGASAGADFVRSPDRQLASLATAEVPSAWIVAAPNVPANLAPVQQSPASPAEKAAAREAARKEALARAYVPTRENLSRLLTRVGGGSRFGSVRPASASVSASRGPEMSGLQSVANLR